MIVLTGANGHLGRIVVERLLQLVPPEEIGVSVRNPEEARDLADRGVRVRKGDFDDAHGLARAFEGANRLLIVSSDVPGPGRVAQHRRAIEAGRAAGAGHLFYTSGIAPSPDSPFRASIDHFETEAALRESGIPSTAIRVTLYTDILPGLFGSALESGTLAVPAGGSVSYATRHDLGEAVAALLVREDTEPVVDLTGPEAHDPAGVARAFGDAAGRSIAHRTIEDGEFRDGLLAVGIPAPFADMTLGIVAGSRRGTWARVDPALGLLIGRAPRTLGEFLERHLKEAQ